jgi:hypothetical protein
VLDPITISALVSIGTSLFSVGYSYYKDMEQIKRERKQKIQDIETQISSMAEDQRKFESISGLKSPAANQILMKTRQEALKKVI